VYAALNGMIAIVVWLSRGRLEPREYDLKEYWTWRGQGPPPWFIRAIKDGGSFWKRDADKHAGNVSEENDSSFDHSRLGSSDNKDSGGVIATPRRVLIPQ
jgi:adenine/guanine/hypoxanthine permease